MMADEFHFLWSKIHIYIAEAGADLIPVQCSICCRSSSGDGRANFGTIVFVLRYDFSSEKCSETYPKFLSLYFVGPNRIPQNFLPNFPAKQKFTDELLQECREKKWAQCGKLTSQPGNRAHVAHFEGFLGFLVMASRNPCLCYKFQ